MTKFTKKGHGIQKWDEVCDEAFGPFKRAITSASILVAPNRQENFRGHTYPSEFGVGRTLTEVNESGKDRVIAFISKKSSPAEQNYTANDR